ncbi:MAG: hypothetical protein PHV82_01580 [Victivallaceae bacterium]|nr:hypothetical protein [Victivallaceae bacterium]
MSKKFIKKNIFMIVFMSIAFIAVIALLVMVFFEHKSMREYDAKKVELLKKINKIFKQQYTPVKVNVLRIEGDAKEFDLESKKVEQKFGHPYEFALRRFAEVVAIPLNDFRAKFGEFWDSQKGKTTRDLIFRRYKVRQFGEDFPNHRSTWNEAMNAFMQEAQKATLEEIDATNVDGIFLAAMGKGRQFSDSPQRCQTFMKRMRYNMIEYYGKKKVDCADTNFSFDDSREPAAGDIEAIANAWEIVSDLAKRVADAKIDPKKDTLQLVEFSKRGLTGEKDGDYTFYRFSFTVNADIATIRRIFKKLYEAYTENRVYAVRDIRIYRMVDKVSDILAESERLKDEIDYDTKKSDEKEVKPPENGRPDPKGGDLKRFGAPPAKTSAPKKSVKEKEQKKILTPKSPGYARTIIGGNNICRAEFEVDYIVCENIPND